jgi:hypothetical protein
MGKASPIMSSFNGGELSPSLDGRVDLGKYATGCKTLENYIPMVQGPARRRSGTRFVNEVKNSNNRCWLIRFEFSETQAFILEFGNNYIRFYANLGQLQTGAVSAWETSKEYFKGDLVEEGGVKYYCNIGHESGTFATDLGNNIWYALEGSIYEIPTPYTSADMTNDNGTLRLRMVQSADVIYIVHPSYAPRKLQRFSNTRWVLDTVQFTNGPFQDIDPDNTIAVWANAASGTVTIRATQGIFSASDVGTLFFIENKDAGGLKPWESQKSFAVNQNPFGERRRSDGKIYFCTTNAAPPAGQRRYTGSTRPTHTRGRFVDGWGVITGTSADGPIGVEWEYESLDYGTVEITQFISATEVVGFVKKKLPFNVVLSTSGGAKTVTAMSQTATGDTRLTVTAHGFTEDKSVLVSLTYRTNSFGTTNTISGTYFATVVDVNTLDINLRFPSPFFAFNTGTLSEVSAGQATPRWAFSRWSPIRGWPSMVAFFRERLVLGTNQTIDMSVSADFENFADKNDEGEVAADMSISVQVTSDQVNTIEWLAPSDKLIIGTVGGEFICGEITSDEVLGPGNVKISQQSVFGSRSVIPVLVKDIVIFVQRQGRKLRDLQYDFGSDAYQSTDLTVLSEHVSAGGITDIVYQQEPHSIIWAVRADGQLLGFTYNKEQEVLGWHRHLLGGKGIVECIESIPRPDGTQDDLWMIVRRTVNGQTKRYIEYLEPDFDENSKLVNAFFVDSGLSYNGINTTSTTVTITGSTYAPNDPLTITFSAGILTFPGTSNVDDVIVLFDNDGNKYRISITEVTSATVATGFANKTLAAELRNSAKTNWELAIKDVAGLSHLEGETVSVLIDGATHPDRVVTGGVISLQYSATIIHVGYACPAKMKTMRLEAGAQDGTAQGKIKRITKAVIRFMATLGGKAGADDDNLDEIQFRSGSDPMSEAPPLFNGDKLIQWPGGYDFDGFITVTQEQPLPMTIVAIMPQVVTQDR